MQNVSVFEHFLHNTQTKTASAITWSTVKNCLAWQDSETARQMATFGGLMSWVASQNFGWAGWAFIGDSYKVSVFVQVWGMGDY
jgi:hypothetical protein